ncbi:hypothetical protein Tco_0743287 [Tanacetum coccineum]
MSRSPEPRRDRSRSPIRKDPEREMVFKRLENGVFHRLGDKEKGMSAYSGSSRRQSHHSIRGDTESYYQSSRSSSIEGEDLSQPWVCEETDLFTSHIRYFYLPKRIRMSSHVKTYDGSEDPEDHLKIFQAAAKVERWAMPTWCHISILGKLPPAKELHQRPRRDPSHKAEGRGVYGRFCTEVQD